MQRNRKTNNENIRLIDIDKTIESSERNEKIRFFILIITDNIEIIMKGMLIGKGHPDTKIIKVL